MSRRLLLVEDDESIREIARLSLERIGGWSVVEAPSGEDALRILTAGETFAAVMMDVMMPGLDGPATLRRLRNDGLLADTPVVFLTAKAQRAERERLSALGAAGVIAKPFDPLTLAGDLEELVGKPKVELNHQREALSSSGPPSRGPSQGRQPVVFFLL